MSTTGRAVLSALCPRGPRGRLMIFTYHRVLRDPDPLRPGIPTAERFERQLAWVRRYCNPLPLSEAVERLIEGRLPARALSITFDDGYADNLEIAAPLLQKYAIPAVVFIAVDAVERGVMWNDLIIEAVRRAEHRLDASSIGLGTLHLDDSTRLSVIQDLIGKIKYRTAKERLEISESIYRSVTRKPLERQMLRSSELPELIRCGFGIGAHTVNHPILTLLDDTEVRAEIAGSRTWLLERTGCEPTLFAYPNGKRDDDYNQRHAEIVRSLGFHAAVSTNWGCATRRSSLFELPRFKPWEDTAFGFYSRMCKVALSSYL